MGHAPSTELAAQPFVMDMNPKTGPERLVGLAMTETNFPSSDDPMFRHFCAVRNEPHLLHWYSKPVPSFFTGDGELPPQTAAEELYAEYVQKTSKIIAQNTPSDKWHPIPLLICKLYDAQSVELPSAENSSVIGVVRVTLDGRAEVALTHNYFNESKTMASIQMACACYRHFCVNVASLADTPWPLKCGVQTVAANLPLLQLGRQFSLLNANAVSLHQQQQQQERREGDSTPPQGETMHLRTPLHVGITTELFEDRAKSVQYTPIPPQSAPLAAGEEVNALLPQHTLKTRGKGSKNRKLSASTSSTENAAPITMALDGLISAAKVAWPQSNAPVTNFIEVKKLHQQRLSSHASSTESESYTSSVTSNSRSTFIPPSPGLSGQSSTTACGPRLGFLTFPNQLATAANVASAIVSQEGQTGSQDNRAIHQQQPPLTPQKSVQQPRPQALSPMQPLPMKTQLPAPARQGTEFVGGAIGHEMPKLFMGDLTPVGVLLPSTSLPAEKQWTPKYWRSPMQPVTRSAWQPYLSRGWVSYDLHQDSVDLYNLHKDGETFNRTTLSGCVFVQVNEAMFTLNNTNGSYLPVRAN